MSNRFDELTRRFAQSAIRRAALKKFGLALAAMVLTCFALPSVSLAQTSVVCDPAGDANPSNSSNGGPTTPAWLDIVQSEITDADSDIHFTLTLNAAIPAAPAWDHVDDGGQLWWGWRFVDDLAHDTIIKDGCIKAAGNKIPSAYFLDLIWDVTSSSFRARLLDDTTCVQNDVPFVFSSDRTQVTLIVSKSLLTNATIIPNPNAFQYFAQTSLWRPNSTGNSGFVHIDNAPDQPAGLVVVPWSSSSNTSFDCP
jgi:hypothetical protein